MAKLFNLACMTTATTGTGTITLGSAVSGFLTFALAGVADADVVSYGIRDGANSEVGTGTYTSSGTTLTRTVTKSTNSDAAINLSGTAQVYVTARAQDLLVIESASAFASQWRVDNSGRLIRGSGGAAITSSSGGIAGFQLIGGSAAENDVILARFSANATPAIFTIAKSRGGSVGTYTLVNTADDIGRFVFDAADGTDLNTAADILVTAEGTVSAGIVPARMVMRVADAAGTLIERVRIASPGQVIIQNGVAVPVAGGTVATTAMTLQFSSTANFGIFVGSDAPTVAAATGSIYLRTNSTGTTDRLYVRTNSATWATVTTSA